MSRRTIAVALLATLTTLGSALPWLGLAPRVSAASCSAWTSESQPPPTIRVFRHVSGAVEVVDFRSYAKNVLSREWIGSWTTESLRSGALAVKHYAWYQVLHWRGGVNADGACFDVRDDTQDQVYDPSKATWSTAAAAVDATWATRVLKNGAIFPTYYNAGAVNEPCGANANGWKMYQWGTQACGLVGKTAAQIVLTYYYPGVTVTDAPASSPTMTPTPSPSPTPTPVATPVATPPPSTPTPTPAVTPAATAAPTAAPTATASPTPAPTATASPMPTPAAPSPTPTPVATPLPPPPPAQELPGGGQAGVTDAAAPPPPPPANPTPVVVAADPDVASATPGADRRQADLRWATVLRRDDAFFGPASLSHGPSPSFIRVEGMHGVTFAAAPTLASGPTLAADAAHWRAALDDLVRAVAVRLAGQRLLALSLPHGTR